MRRSHIHQPAPERRGPRRPSASTAAGLAAERAVLADRERDRRTSRARHAARELEKHPASV
jgi:hypothetical protein